MNRRNFLKKLTGGALGIALAGILPDSVIAQQASKRHAEVLVESDYRCYITIGDSPRIEVSSLNLTIRHDVPPIKELGSRQYLGFDNRPTTKISIEHRD